MPTIKEEDADSGLDLTGSAPNVGSQESEPKKDDDTVTKSPEKKTLARPQDVEADDDDEELDETLTERLIGLTEMFPESVRNGVGWILENSWDGVKSAYGFSRKALWIGMVTVLITVVPAQLELERMNMANQQKQQERQMLLGPHAAFSSSNVPQNAMPMMAMPGGPPPPQ
ncbi:mitochondrial import receptor subunit TOM22 homolog [Lingula anatina]|uniref:Mitochondrial import receptor subunit TOM22 homolog n=1 Tax=Lingula anatina TaxID=7574 RepID=A0A1S3K377_LINAN|nr:mitochondrial import receptor subunit TOM22 homolog [Lingula anatina]|eukprot:XP_013416982.1 mitochondrial import receptor subunit TOM22 homolog [Lingula anatina]